MICSENVEPVEEKPPETAVEDPVDKKKKCSEKEDTDKEGSTKQPEHNSMDDRLDLG